MAELFELLSISRNKDFRRMFDEFGAVQSSRTVQTITVFNTKTTVINRTWNIVEYFMSLVYSATLLNCLNHRVIQGGKIIEQYFKSSGLFHSGELLELSRNKGNKDHRTIFTRV